MARPQQVSDEQIFAAARDAFVEHGPSVSVAVVAEKLGVSQAALFQRIGSKEQLMRGALAPGEPACSAALAAGPRDNQPVERQLTAILLDLHSFLSRVVPSLLTLRAAGISLGKEGVTPPPVAMRAALAKWLRAASVPGDAKLAAEELLSVIEARCFNRHVGGDSYAPGDDAALIRALVRDVFKRRPS